MRRLCRIIVLTSILPAAVVPIAAAEEKQPAAAPAKFELRDGDRVVFLGNTLIERAQKYGYWETLLTAQYPDRDITFRNLGWSGDTVWAESRGMFDPPEVGYKRMIEHVGRLKPTVIFLGYGNNEAFAGKEGLPAFVKQYDKLLDDLTRVSAEGVRFVILSPAYVAPTRLRLPNQAAQHANRKVYRNAMSDIAKKRSMYFVDLLSELETKRLYSRLSDGIFPFAPDDPSDHISENGVGRIVNILHNNLVAPFEQFTLFSEDWPGIGFNHDGTIYARVHVEATNVKRTESGLKVDLACSQLPFMELVSGDSDFYLGVSDLAAGKYQVRVDGQVWKTVDHEQLREGIDVEFHYTFNELGAAVKRGLNLAQLNALRKTIIEKNRLYFHRWRPQNVTYLFGFRKHEQGQNAKEVAEFDKLIAAKEKEINRLKKPVAHTYEIIRVKEGKEKDEPKSKPKR